MLYSAFDEFIPASRQEKNKPNGGLLPPHLLSEIDEMGTWVYDTINNGVYKAGFAATQEAHESAVRALFKSLDRIEDILARSEGPYLFGSHITDADIKLYPTIARFDVAYHTLFMCNLKMIRHDYPHIQKWYLGLYYDESEETRGAFKASTHFDAVSRLCDSIPRC
jgi:putative glutathione S-transferase